MSLNNMVVFQDQLVTTIVEILKEKAIAFNAAVGNAIVLRPGKLGADFRERAFFAAMGNLIRRRDPYGTGAIGTETISMKQKSDVKVGSGTPVVEWTAAQFDWVDLNPELAASILGKNLAQQMMDDYFDTAVAVLYAAMRNDDALLRTDKTSASPDTASWGYMAEATAKFGDASGKLNVWLSHSKPMHDIWQDNLTNAERLFTFGTVNVVRDPFGRVIVISDSPSLKDTTTTPGTPIFHMMGLTPNSVSIEQNDDFRSVIVPITGDENLKYNYQGEWSFNMSVKGYSWDTANGGKAPNNAALKLNTNWDRYENDANFKNLPGVILEVN